MISRSTDIPKVKRFLVELTGGFMDFNSPSKPYLVLGNHGAHNSQKVRELLSH